jgi:Mn2+/Fe2+ NRAMP family transporter
LLLPVLLTSIVMLCNNEEIMGKYTNGLIFNIVAWSVTIAVSLLSVLLIAKTFADMF